MTDLATNALSYGDNVEILRRYLPDATVDLVYLDPIRSAHGRICPGLPRRSITEGQLKALRR